MSSSFVGNLMDISGGVGGGGGAGGVLDGPGVWGGAGAIACG